MFWAEDVEVYTSEVRGENMAGLDEGPFVDPTFNPQTWRFVQKLQWAHKTKYRGHRVILEPVSVLQILGVLLYALALATYIWLFSSDSLTQREIDIVLAVIVLHCAELFLVIMDAVRYTGNSVLLQTVIIAIGLFNVFALAGILGAGMGARKLLPRPGSNSLCGTRQCPDGRHALRHVPPRRVCIHHGCRLHC